VDAFGWADATGPEGKDHTFESCRVRQKACAERAGTVAAQIATPQRFAARLR